MISFFYAQRIKGFDPPGAPSLDDETLAFLTTALGHTSLYLEYGSGGSTVLASNLGVRTISVESDPYYARAVRKAVNGATTILTPNIGITGPWGWPLFKRPTKRRLARWQSYVDAPWPIIGSFPDLIMVDGRFRVACALESARQARLHGATATLLFDDYATRTPIIRSSAILALPNALAGRLCSPSAIVTCRRAMRAIRSRPLMAAGFHVGRRA